MKKSEQNMNGSNRVKKAAKNTGTIRATISIDDDCHPEHSEAVRNRMKERRTRSYSHFIETLIAEDIGLIPKLQEVTA
jgi:hypothetical protein